MTEAVIVALITGGLALIGTVISSISHSKLTSYKIEELKQDIAELNDHVKKHNNFMERIAMAESSLKSAHKRIDEIKGGRHS